MAVVNIKYITQAIITFLNEGFKVHFPSSDKNISPNSPSKDGENGLYFYLFHIQESPHHKNIPSPGMDHPPIRFAPMGLHLYYQLTANFNNQEGNMDAYQEQEMMGVAMKLLHDYPEINDKTTINGLNIFNLVDALTPPFGLKDRQNRIKISLLPVNYSDSVHYWTAGSSAMRLSAYYEVSMVFLEPEPPTSYAGRVLQYGTFLFPEGAARITASHNKLSFPVPPSNEIRSVDIQPAQAPFGNDIGFYGTGFQGDQLELILFRPGWDKPCVASGWNLRIENGNKITVTVQEQAVEKGSNPVVNRDVLPGIYTAQVQVSRRRTLPNGEIRAFESSSNQFPFTITPKITGITGPVGSIFTVKGHIFQHAELEAKEIMVLVGDIQLLRDNALGPGTFSTPSADTLQFNPPPGLSSGDILPLRIIISGAESPPRWITLP